MQKNYFVIEINAADKSDIRLGRVTDGEGTILEEADPIKFNFKLKVWATFKIYVTD